MVLYLKNESQFLFFFRCLEFDGLFLSNGPGDPQTQCPETIATISSWIKSKTIKPVFGICLGHQVQVSNQLILFII
jgi:carbamoylphosphate synthase small subunit